MGSLCLVGDCAKKSYCLGYCTKHYQQLKKHGVVNKGRAPYGCSLEEKLKWIGWTVTASGCWEWNGSRTRDGYGRVRFNGKLMLVSRASFQAWKQPIKRGYDVCHTCDNPPCMNPEHLWQGTVSDNLLDMYSKGRGSNRVRDTQGRFV